MKNIVTRIQELNQKAAQIKEAIASVPPKIAEVRDTVLTATGQLQHLRENVQASVTSLRTDDQNSLVQALREIDDSATVFHEAGYELDDVEMELGLLNRLVVHLEKLEDVDHESIKVLIAENTNHKTVHAILTALIKAEELSDGVKLKHLDYHKLTVYVGPAPCVRLCWQTPQSASVLKTASAPATVHESAPVSAAVVTVAGPAPSAFTQSSFFEKRTPAPTPTPYAPATTTVTIPAPTPTSVTRAATVAMPVEAGTGDWRKDALARFKKMPDLSKR